MRSCELGEVLPLWRLILQGPSLWPDPLAGNPGLLYSRSWVLKDWPRSCRISQWLGPELTQATFCHILLGDASYKTNPDLRGGAAGSIPDSKSRMHTQRHSRWPSLVTVTLIIFLCCWMFLFKEIRRPVSYAVAVYFSQTQK